METSPNILGFLVYFVFRGSLIHLSLIPVTMLPKDQRTTRPRKNVRQIIYISQPVQGRIILQRSSAQAYTCERCHAVMNAVITEQIPGPWFIIYNS